MACIEEALEEDSEQAVQARLRFVQRDSWENRIKVISELIDGISFANAEEGSASIC